MSSDTAPLTEQEMIEILEDLARNSNSATARIQAIKQLRVMRGDEPAATAEGFDALDELAERRGQKVA